MAGKFIVFEGLDMSGKTSQIAILRTYLEIAFKNKKFIYTKEPGSDLNKIAPKIREILLHTDEILSSNTEVLLYAADRSHHVQQIKKLLDNDINIICDRYFYTSLAYQAYAGTLDLDTVLDINSIATQGLVPDLYIHMNISIEEYIKRKSARNTLDRIESKDVVFFEKAINGYNNMMSDIKKSKYPHMLPKKCISINAEGNMNNNANLIIEAINKIL